MVDTRSALAASSGLLLLVLVSHGVYKYSTIGVPPSVPVAIALPALAAAWTITMGPPPPIPVLRR